MTAPPTASMAPSNVPPASGTGAGVNGPQQQQGQPPAGGPPGQQAIPGVRQPLTTQQIQRVCSFVLNFLFSSLNCHFFPQTDTR